MISLVLEVAEKRKSGLEKFMEKHGIKRIGSQLGFSEKEQKFYGWSHRAIYGFGIGHKVKKGNMPHKYEGKTAKTLEDAKRFAVAFASDVS